MRAGHRGGCAGISVLGQQRSRGGRRPALLGLPASTDLSPPSPLKKNAVAWQTPAFPAAVAREGRPAGLLRAAAAYPRSTDRRGLRAGPGEDPSFIRAASHDLQGPDLKCQNSPPPQASPVPSAVVGPKVRRCPGSGTGTPGLCGRVRGWGLSCSHLRTQGLRRKGVSLLRGAVCGEGGVIREGFGPCRRPERASYFAPWSERDPEGGQGAPGSWWRRRPKTRGAAREPAGGSGAGRGAGRGAAHPSKRAEGSEANYGPGSPFPPRRGLHGGLTTDLQDKGMPFRAGSRDLGARAGTG